MKKLIIAIACASLLWACGNKKEPESVKVDASTKTKKEEPKSVYVFTQEKLLPVTSVKNQQNSGTCWCFATVSFLESELLRQGKGDYDLSELYCVYYAYLNKGKSTVRRHGKQTTSQGGQAHDVINVIHQYGIVPKDTYRGMPAADTIINHSKIADSLNLFLQKIVKMEPVPENWFDDYTKIANSYFGVPPADFEYKGKKYTPKQFAATLVNLDDYVELTSYKCYPFYEKVMLEIPDNWSNSLYYNLPIDDFMRVIDNSIEQGYTVVWDGDVSEKGFSHKNCAAIAPLKNVDSLFTEIRTEVNVDDDLRQKTFDSYETTDDHLMHLVGISRDQSGAKYYIIKNSWGVKRNDCGGFLNMSVPFTRLKTTAIMVNKNAIPKDIATKLKIK